MHVYTLYPHTRTRITGLSAVNLTAESGAVPYEEARAVVAALMNRRVVVGHALKNDFQVPVIYNIYTIIYIYVVAARMNRHVVVGHAFQNSFRCVSYTIYIQQYIYM